jgi:hypothetical protein
VRLHHFSKATAAQRHCRTSVLTRSGDFGVQWRMLRVHRLTKRYGALTAIQDLSFEVGRGEIIGLSACPGRAAVPAEWRIVARPRRLYYRSGCVA